MRLKKVKHIATIAAKQAHIRQQGFYANPSRAELIVHLKASSPEAKLLDLGPHLTHLRVIKQPQELVALQQAVSITAVALKQVTKKLNSYKTEFEIEADIARNFKRRESKHGYDPIIASGVNACTLHYHANQAELNSKELVLIDVGAEVSNYSADITRTYALSKPSKRQQVVYDAVLEVQKFALSCLKPGVDLRTYEYEVEQFMGEKLRELHLIKSISHENVRQYYPHGTSHFLGLDVHDVGDYERPLEAGMVLTVEPGIYIPSEQIGVRIEDDVLLGADGPQILSASLPRALS